LNNQINVDLMAKSCNNIFYMFCLLMDKYTLLRMFRSFGIKRKTVNNRNIYSGRTKNIIFYGGNLHANIYREFLSKYGEVIHDLTQEMKIERIGPLNKCNNCLNIDISTTGFIESEPIITKKSSRNSFRSARSSNSFRSARSNKSTNSFRSARSSNSFRSTRSNKSTNSFRSARSSIKN